MKVALLLPEYPGCGPAFGIGRYAQILATGLIQRGHQVLILAVTADGFHRVEGDSHQHQPAPPTCRGPMRPRIASSWISQQLQAWQPDLIEISNWGGLAAHLDAPAPMLCRISSPIACHALPGLAQRALKSWYHRNEQRSVMRSDRVVADSTIAASMCHAVYGRACDSVVHHGIDPEPSTHPDADAQDLLYLGRLESRKGIDRLLQAWPAVVAADPTRRLHIVGADPAGLATVNSAASITFHGKVSDAEVQAIKRRCLVQVIPSRFESFGLVVLEAWRDGLAIVATAGGALPEVIADAGLVVHYDTQLAATISALLADPTQMQQLATRGRERLITDFSVDAFLTKTLSEYAQLVGSPP